MALSNELISQFAKLTAKPETTKTESTVYGTAKIENDTVFVKIDGSDRLTPVQTTVDVEDGERVIVSVKDHSATITGNTSPNGNAARVETVKNQGKKIDEFDIVVSYKVTTDELTAINATIENLKAISASYEDMTAVTAQIESLQAKFANLEYVDAEEVTAILAEIETIHAMFGEFTVISTEDLEAANAEIDNLQAHTANFTYVSTELLRAYKASIEQLDVEKLNANFANMDYANIDEATFKKFYANSGLIQDVVIDEATVTTYLIGVTIKGDLIEAGTIVADKLVVKGNDGLYYKLNTSYETVEAEQTEYNSLNGRIITAKSITAEKMSVSDLAAFQATIGNFTIAPSVYEYFKMEETITPVEGVRVSETYTTTGEEVYSYLDADGVPKFCCEVDSVYYKVSVEETKPGAIYSGVKNSIDNTTNGLYLGSDGQIALGDEKNYLKYYKDEDGNYKFTLSAESIFFGAGKDFTLDNRGLTVEGNSDESNIPIKTIVSNNGMTVHSVDEKGAEKEMLVANDKGVAATDLHAKTYMIVGKSSRLEDYDVPIDTNLAESASGPGDVNFYCNNMATKKTYTFSAKVVMPVSDSSTIIVQSYPNGVSSEYDIRQNNKISFTFTKENDDTTGIALYAPVDFIISSWSEWMSYVASDIIEIPENIKYMFHGYSGGIMVVPSDWDGTTAPGMVYPDDPTMQFSSGSYRILLDLNPSMTDIPNLDIVVTMKNIDKLNVTDYKLTEHVYRTGCFWIGE